MSINTSSKDVKRKIYLNAIRLAFPYSNKVFNMLINQENKVSNWLSYLWSHASQSELKELGLTEKQMERFMEARREIDPEKEYALLLRENVSMISRKDPAYPEMLGTIHDAPEILYLQGDKSLLTNQNISIVGPRNPSPYGREIVRKIISDFVPYGFTVVSGLAVGIDSLAHEIAIKKKLPTIAVLGAGHGSLEPKSHFQLIKELTTNQLVISEYPFNATATKFTFPMRNRIISGLSLGTIVVEARERSGSLITAQLANEQGSNVFAVPGSLFNECSRGTNLYIQSSQAEPYLDVQTMIDSLNLSAKLDL